MTRIFTEYAVGLMSGTSTDGIDVAIVKITEMEVNDQLEIDLVYFNTIAYEPQVKKEILNLCNPETAKLNRLSKMNMLLGYLYAEAVNNAIEKSELNKEDISFISSHGQTIFHQPIKAEIGGHVVTSSLQIGDINVIAEKTGIPTVGDFRTRDMAAGGQGAPLVPYADYLLFKNEQFGRVLVNIGGISNITMIPKNAAESDVIAYDTGPGNMIMDYFAEQITFGELTYDKDGLLARSGKVNQQWLKELLQHPYFVEKPPKSTGREVFGKDYAKKLWNQAEDKSIPIEDRMTTVTELTAITLTNEINIYVEKAALKEILISGGGRNNSFLMERIRFHLNKQVVLKGTEEYGIHPEAKEAMIFALLGYQSFKKRTNNLPAATGSTRHVVMGKVAWGHT